MSNDQSYAFFLICLLLLLVGVVASSGVAAPAFRGAPPEPGRVATAAELTQARAEWEQSAHASTYDRGMGANTTCARCKSPQNWNPDAPGAQEALNCASCKRVPGAPRPDLTAGVTVPRDEWQHIPCEICHIPVGESYGVGLAFWNEATGTYEAVADETALCAHCHHGRHGFAVVEEQERSPAHQGWACSRCHGAHGAPAACIDCHDPEVGEGAAAHEQHPNVHCTACHDAGHLGIWKDPDPNSPHYGEYITVRFEHTLTSWPSHNIQTESKCERCHHPRGEQRPAVAAEVGCQVCHQDGAVLFWCAEFERDGDPTAGPGDR